MGMVDLVVTQHTALVELLRERGIATDSTAVITHATAKDIEGKHVVGVLPHHLSCLCASYTEVQIAITAEERTSRAELSIERLREIAGPAVTYKVTRL